MKAIAQKKKNADATPAAFKISLTVLPLIPFLNALSNDYYKSNRVVFLGVNMFLARLRTK